ncbi:MAG: lysophospholipid acyltransferase family protein [Bacteroidota bacterium]
MQGIVFYLIYPILKLLSWLPFSILYGLSKGLYFLIYKLVGYRKKVVRANLKLAFPNYSKEKRLEIEKKSYQHFCDLIVEMIKTISISAKELKQRFVFKNPEKIKEIEALEKSNIYLCGHYANYEWITALKLYGMNYESYGVYKRLRNPYFDQLVRKIRSRFDTTMVDKNDLPKLMAKNKLRNKKAGYGMIADQSPKLHNAKYWQKFMGTTTPVFIGPELLAKRFNYSVHYLKIEKLKQGYYSAEIITLANETKSIPNFELTKSYLNHLEEQIRNRPELYFWTHKRWKHQK